MKVHVIKASIDEFPDGRDMLLDIGTARNVPYRRHHGCVHLFGELFKMAWER